MNKITDELELVYSYGYNTFSKILVHDQVMQSIDFLNEDDLFIHEGWYGIEGPPQFKYRWTTSEFSLFLPAQTTKIKFLAMIPSKPEMMAVKSMELFHGQKSLGTLSLPQEYDTWSTFQMNLSQPTSTSDYVVFKLNYYYCPQELGLGQDTRKLGLAISRMDFIKK